MGKSDKTITTGNKSINAEIDLFLVAIFNLYFCSSINRKNKKVNLILISLFIALNMCSVRALARVCVCVCVCVCGYCCCEPTSETTKMYTNAVACTVQSARVTDPSLLMDTFSGFYLRRRVDSYSR